MLPRDLLTGLEHREVITRLLDLGDRALQTWEVVCSDFLSPPELIEAQQVFKKFTEVQFVTYGGYDRAERCRVGISHIDLPLEPRMVNLAAIDIVGNFLFDPASHRDFLGAILGSGIERQKVGDLILLGEKGAQAIVVPELVEYLSVSLTQVRTVPVKVRSIDLANLCV